MFSKVKNFVKQFIHECQEKDLILLAASSSFFFFLCLIPIILLLLNFVALMFESVTPKETLSFLNYIESVIPNDILPTFQMLFKHSTEMMQSNTNTNWLHYLILSLSSLGFFGSIWRSVDIIVERKKYGTLLRTLKSFLTIAISFGFILLLAAMPLFFKFTDYLMTNDFLKKFKVQEIFFSDFQQYEFSGVNVLSTFLLFGFFIFFFRFLLHGNATFKATMVGSSVFTLGVVVTKMAFFTYLIMLKDNLVSNYGHLYSIMIFVLWVYTLILLFYMAIIFTYVLSRQRFKILSNFDTPPETLTR